jgi:sugar/nucleoside kinase (ribokinase family)
VRFVAVGDVMVDVLVSGRDHDAVVELAPGGSAVNAARSAAALGAEAEVVGRVGDDPAGRMLVTELAAHGVRASLGVDPVLPTGTFLVLDDEVRVDRGANAGLLPEHLPGLEADAVLVSGHLPADTVTEALGRARAAWCALAVARLSRLPEGGDAIFANEEEARALTGEKAAGAARALGARYRLACVTRGPAGAVGALDGHVESMDATPAGGLAEGQGAGDAFAAAVLVAVAKGGPLREALAAGCRAGALALQRPRRPDRRARDSE